MIANFVKNNVHSYTLNGQLMKKTIVCEGDIHYYSLLKTFPLLFLRSPETCHQEKTLWNQFFDANVLCLVRPNGLADCETAPIFWPHKPTIQSKHTHTHTHTHV